MFPFIVLAIMTAIFQKIYGLGIYKWTLAALLAVILMPFIVVFYTNSRVVIGISGYVSMAVVYAVMMMAYALKTPEEISAESLAVEKECEKISTPSAVVDGVVVKTYVGASAMYEYLHDRRTLEKK